MHRCIPGPKLQEELGRLQATSEATRAASYTDWTDVGRA